MRRFFCAIGVACGLVVAAASWPARADVLDHLWGHSGPPTLTDVAKMIDQIQRSLVNQGTVVIKQPDVWSQARMTQFRQEYEDTMAAQLTKFDLRLAGRIARSDAASFNSQTALAASISPMAPGQNLQLQASQVPAELSTAVNILNGTGSGAIGLPGNSAFPKDNPTSNFSLMTSIAPTTGGPPGTTNAVGIPLSLEPNVQLDEQSDYINHLHRLRRINLGDDNADSAGYGLYLMRVPLSIQPGDHTKKGFGAIANLTIRHDFTPEFLQATYRNLVINDVVDKLAPVIHELIRSGAAVHYELQKDKIDEALRHPTPESVQPFSGLVTELSNLAHRTGQAPFAVNRAGARRNAIAPSDLAQVFQIRNLLVLGAETQRALGVIQTRGETVAAGATVRTPQFALALDRARRESTSAADNQERAADMVAIAAKESSTKASTAEVVRKRMTASIAAEKQMHAAVRELSAKAPVLVPGAVSNLAVPPLAASAVSAAAEPTSVADAAQAQVRAADDSAAAAKMAEEDAKSRKTAADAEAEKAASDLQKATENLNRDTEAYRNRVRLIDVRSYLRNQLDGAYDLVAGSDGQQLPILQDVDFIEMLVEKFRNREFEGPKFKSETSKDKDGKETTTVQRVTPNSSHEENGFTALYEQFVDRLPGNLHDRGLGALAWGIALEAGLLNRHLREDMKQTKGNNDYCAPPDVDLMCFYVPKPPEEIQRAFQDYVKARWPVITFALEPVVDQQNIEDAFTRRRDLQLAVAFALASGRIGFRQAMTFTRSLQYEAQTIALNQTVSAFANGNDTFGWRITPRYQTPPEESNFGALTNTIFRGGPSPNRQLAYAKIEPGMRELTAVVVMPSFVRGVRVDTWSDWFRLTDPESRKLHTARTVEIGKRINEARDCLEAACKHGDYRPEDVERLRVRLHQLETMLPIQTAFVRVPYENTLGGFALFSQGKTDLVPQLDGYDGLDYIETDTPTDLIIHGRNFSLYETSVVVGGKSLAREGTRSFVVWDTGGKPYTLSALTNPIRDKDGNLVLQILGADNKQTTVTVPDPGSYLIQSREVMRLRVPKGVATVKRADGTEAVEVNVSTPTGISNRLLIPVQPKPAAKTPAPPAPAPGFADTATIVDPVVTIRYMAKIKSDGSLDRKARLGVMSGSRVRILPAAPPTNSADKAEVSLEFPVANPKTTVLNAFRISDVVFENGCYVLKENQLNDLAARLEALLAGSNLDPKAESTFTTRNVSLSIPGAKPTKQLKTTNQLTVNFEFVVAQTPETGSPTATATLAPAPLRDDQARTTSDERIVIPPPARPLNLDDLPALPQSQPWDAETDADEPFEEAADALPPDAPFERLAPRVAFQEAADAPAPAASPVVTPTAAPPATTTPPTQDNRPATVVIPPPVVPQTIVVAPQPPSVNVSVPITNVAKPPRQGLFHRDREPATPQNPARRSLLQRAINGP